MRPRQLWLLFVLAFLYLPFFFLMGQKPEHYLNILSNDEVFGALLNSLQLASMATLICQPICLLLLLLSSQGLEKAVGFLMGIPEILISLSLLLAFSTFGWSLGFGSLLFGHVLLILPFCSLVLRLSWQQIPKEFNECAQDLGATARQTFFLVQWPLLRPAFLASSILGFLLSFDDFLLSYFLGGADYETLPVRILASLKIGLSPELKALSSLLLVFSVVLIMTIGPILLSLLKKEVTSETK